MVAGDSFACLYSSYIHIPLSHVIRTPRALRMFLHRSPSPSPIHPTHNRESLSTITVYPNHTGLHFATSNVFSRSRWFPTSTLRHRLCPPNAGCTLSCEIFVRFYSPVTSNSCEEVIQFSFVAGDKSVQSTSSSTTLHSNPACIYGRRFLAPDRHTEIK